MVEDYEFVPYKDISDLKRELEGVKDRKEVSTKDLHDSVRKLTDTMNSMLSIFSAAAEQLKLEDKEYDAENKKHETIISKLEKLIEQNKTIAEGMVAIVELVKGRFPQKEREEPIPKSYEEEPAFVTPQPKPQTFGQPEFRPTPPLVPKNLPQMQPISSPVFLRQTFDLPPMEPAPMPDLDFPEVPFPPAEEPRKKSLFGGMFKK